ncbi:hypothetical protein [Rothia sp. P4278]|uniref:hypothetical protein n=1 Tax=Rothia sp. P4278 TaxID=3402658 RepID=UPI003ADA1762
MSRFLRPLITLLACLLAVFLVMGWQGIQRQEGIKADLAGQITIALELKTLREAAEAEGQDILVTALDDSLAQLAPAARDFAESSQAEPLPQQLTASADALVQFGLKTDSLEDRARALTAVTRLWSAALSEGITDNKYPAALAQKIKELENFTCTNPQGEAPEPSSSLEQMQEVLYRINYASEVYAARADKGYTGLAAKARTLAQQSAALRDTVTPALICSQRLETIQPSYPTVAPEQAESQLRDLTATLPALSMEVFSDPAVSTTEDSIEVIALALALHTLD